MDAYSSQCPLNLLSEKKVIIMEKRYTLYYKTDKIYIFREGLTKDQVDKFLKVLTPIEKSYLRITEMKKIKDDTDHDYIDR